VQVCPTGIDIRNGTQLECINCTACIDECNDVMEKIHQPKGLIRYASQEEISRGSKKRVTLRSVAYMTILVVLISVLTYLLATRDEVATTILRTPGMLYQQQDAEHISNMYNFEVVNKTFDDQHIDLKIKSPANTTLKMVDRNTSELLLKEDDIVKGSFFLIMPQQGITQNNIEAEIELYSNGNLIKTIKTNFVAPVK
jgi:polyferredoxin